MERFSANQKMGFYLQFVLLLLIITMITGCNHSKPLGLKPSENIRVRLYAENTGSLHIGDSIPLILTIEARKGVSFQVPGFDESTSAGLELKSQEPAKTETFPTGIRQTTRYLMAGWHVGQYTIPALSLPYETPSHQQGKIKTYPLLIKLSSVLPKGILEAELLTFNIKGIQSPLSLEPRYSMLKWFLLGAFILCCLGLFLHFYRRSLLQSQGSAEAGKEPADIIALRRLANLKTLEVSGETGFKVYYSELSECIREYMENRYSIHALEMTTEEFLIRLTTETYLNTEQQSLLKDFLEQSDLVKFANHRPSKAEAEGAFLQIEQLIETTKELPVESDEPAVQTQTTL